MGVSTCVKYLMFILNSLFMIAGIALIAIGVLVKIFFSEIVENMDKHFSLTFTVVPVVGSVFVVISFFGCCGAIRENTCMLTTYAIILLIIFIIQVALGVFALIQFKNSVEGSRRETGIKCSAIFEQYYTNDVARQTVDSLQYGLPCCGLENANYWVNSTIPSSCCANKPDVCHKSMAFPEGCVAKLFQFVHNIITKIVTVIGIVVVVIAIIELAGSIVALRLSSSIRNYKRRELHV